MGDASLLMGSLSAETARSKVEEPAPLEVGRLLYGPVRGCGISRVLIGLELGAEPWPSGLDSAVEAGLRGTGVLLREIQMPSTWMPLWMARIPKGTSSSSVGPVADSTICGSCEFREPWILLYFLILQCEYQTLSQPAPIVQT